MSTRLRRGAPPGTAGRRRRRRDDAPGAPQGPVPWSRRAATAGAGIAAGSARRGGGLDEGPTGGQAGVGETGGEAPVAPGVDVGAGGDVGRRPRPVLAKVSRLEMAAPAPTGRAAQVRPVVSRTQAEVGSAMRKDDQ